MNDGNLREDLELRFTPLQRGTLEMLVQRCDRSPLLKDIICTLVKSRTSSSALLAVGRDLQAYAVPQTFQPGTRAYRNAEVAWKNRNALTVTPNVLPNHEEVLASAMSSIATRRAKSGHRPNAVGGIEEDVNIPRNIL